MMRTKCTVSSVLLSLLAILIAEATEVNADVMAMSSNSVRFIENRGQIVDTDGRVRNDIRCVADCGGARLFFTDRGISYVFSDSDPAVGEREDMRASMEKSGPDPQWLTDITQGATRLYRADMELAGSAAFPRIRFEQELPGYTNYYLAHCPDGITHVKSYARVVYENVYPSIDLVFIASDGKMKYEYRVRPGGNPALIRMRYGGMSDLGLLANGTFELHTPLGRMEEAAPYTFEDGGREIRSAYRLRGNELTFDVAAYDRSRTLVIDPWSTYFGGSGRENSSGIVADGSGGVVISGHSTSLNYPVLLGSQTTNGGGNDLVITSFNSSGSPRWSTYYGGAGLDMAFHLAMGGGVIAVTGYTQSASFPVLNANQSTYGGGPRDAHIVTFNAAGQCLWATYCGGIGSDQGWGVAVDGNGNVYASGVTGSSDFPILNAAQNSLLGLSDAYLCKYSTSGVLQWATFYGGNDEEQGKRIFIDANGDVLFIGGTKSTNFPVINGMQGSLAGDWDVFISRFSSVGIPQWASYLGGSGTDIASNITAMASGAFACIGTTNSQNFPVTNGHQTSLAGSFDLYVTVLSSAGTIVWSTYLGGVNSDYGQGVTVDPSGNILICGSTTSTNYPVANAFQSASAGGQDAVAAMFSTMGSLLWSTYLGGSGDESLNGAATDAFGNLCCTGYSNSTNFPVYAATQSQYAGDQDIIIVSFSSSGMVPVYLLSFTASQNDGSVKLVWRTAGETDNHGFFVERSSSSDHTWESIGFVAGNGTTSEEHEYSLTDYDFTTASQPRVVSYRLRQVNTDGSFEYSSALTVHIEPAFAVTAFLPPAPNPADASLTVSFSLHEDATITLLVYDAVGRMIRRICDAETFASGTYAISLATHALLPGMYLARLSTPEETHVQTFTIVR